MARARRPADPLLAARLVRLPGSANQYRDPQSGEVFSRRQRGYIAGKPLPTQRLIDRPQGRVLVAQYMEMHPGVSQAEARTNPELRNAVRELSALDRKRKAGTLNEPEAIRFAAALDVLHPEKRPIDYAPYVRTGD